MGKQIHPKGYWTDEKIIEESKKYQYKKDFKRCSIHAYQLACRKGLMSHMNWLKEDRHKERGPRKEHKYTKDVIKEIILQYNCKTTADLRKCNEYAYKKAKENDWLIDLGLVRYKHEDGYWTEERVWNVAKQYSNKADFSKKETEAYKWACHYQLLTEMDWMRCPTYEELRDRHDSEVYAFIDETNKVVYVGLSIDTQNRMKSHKYQKNSAVRKYFGKNIPKPIILKSNLTIEESTKYEDLFRNKFFSEGYHILNTAPTGLNVGSIGGISKWSSKELVFKEARKYHSKKEFRQNVGGAYNHAYANSWLKEMTWLQATPKKIKWTHDKVIEESHKYNYKGEFCNGSPGAYKVAKDNGWLEEMPWIKEKRKPSNYWTKSRVFEVSHNYTNKKAFESKDKTAYWWANRMGWIKQMIWLKPLPLGHISEWTRKRIIEESKKYTSKSEFALNSPTAYMHAIKDKSIFSDMPWLVERKKANGFWKIKSNVMTEGRKYNSRTAFAKGSYSAWKSAKKNGWIDEMIWFKSSR